MESFKIPMPPHLVAFTRAEFFPGQEAPYYLDEGSEFGKYTFSLLSDIRTISPRHYETQTHLEITLSSTLSRKSPSLLKLCRLTTYVNNYFHRLARVHVDAQMKLGQSRIASIKDFLSTYNIEESSTLIHTLRKYQERKQNPELKQKSIQD